MNDDTAARRTSVANVRRDAFVLAAAVGVVGIAFGVLARTAGLTVGQACVMSLCVFTGASQFAAVAVISGGGSGVAALGSAVLLAVRNALYGPLVHRWLLAERPSTRVLLAQIVIDESAGVGAAQPDVESSRHSFVAAGLGVYVAWNLGTLLGALVGDVVGSVEAWGLDAAFPSVFIALLAPHLHSQPARLTTAIAAVVTASTIPFVPIGVPILVAALSVVPGAVFTSRRARSW